MQDISPDRQTYISVIRLMEQQQEVVLDALRSNGDRRSRDKVDALTRDLMEDWQPKKPADKAARVALVVAGLLPEA